ncbi:MULTISPECIES: putative entry exclusion protein TrbK-alt [unclassified Bradyrhizobium]|uniref:putative entry exclusion protein TrbK-alt n=1 Tax=Bradyrhizobium sp. USDA 4541 TaxID=2817704 RepID=UPI0020A3B6EC|nr:putative entry exclusion protein TrbK-alt [Bradyrhizobium sp. USDA 4541]MCP1850604.1 conjugative transfer region protein TrbK [Bradyrhizobium sp. USDA 4541]
MGIRVTKWLPASMALGATLVAAACAIQLRGADKDAAQTQADAQMTGAFSPDLARCRTVTPEQATEFERCRRLWAENRRRFFGQKAGPVRGADGDPGGSSQQLAPKDQGRIPQAYPSIGISGEGDQ